MGREKKTAPGVVGTHAKERHKKVRRSRNDPSLPLPSGLIAKPPLPKPKHHSYLEFVENKGKKKKLEFKTTTRHTPPPGFEFVPLGNPELTTACKELSREQDAMIFIVSAPRPGGLSENRELAHHLNRVGHHVRRTIAEEAREAIGDLESAGVRVFPGIPEPIPESQAEINAQADAALRDLFPRIPNTDRIMIVQRAFRKGSKLRGAPLVGLAPNLTLSRRAQLAALAHIRHTHTRYDELLRETSYLNARKAVERLCLDILVKWRGDEETGRDQLDEVLREVIVISDSEQSEDESDADSDFESDEQSAYSDDESVEEVPPPSKAFQIPGLQDHSSSELVAEKQSSTATAPLRAPSHLPGAIYTETADLPPLNRTRNRRPARTSQRSFERYQAVRDRVWREAVERQRQESSGAVPQASPMDRTTSHGSQLQEPDYAEDWVPPAFFFDEPRHSVGSRHYHRRVRYNDHPEMSPRDGNQSVVTASRPAQATANASAEGRSVSGGLITKVGFNPVSRGHQSTVSPVVRERGDLKDWLVMSTEPRSPEQSQFPPRTTPSTGAALTRGQPETVPVMRTGVQFIEHRSSGGSFDVGEGPSKRRRLVDDEPKLLWATTRQDAYRVLMTSTAPAEAHGFAPPPPRDRESNTGIVGRGPPSSFRQPPTSGTHMPPTYRSHDTGPPVGTHPGMPHYPNSHPPPPQRPDLAQARHSDPVVTQRADPAMYQRPHDDLPQHHFPPLPHRPRPDTSRGGGVYQERAAVSAPMVDLLSPPQPASPDLPDFIEIRSPNRKFPRGHGAPRASDDLPDFIEIRRQTRDPPEGRNPAPPSHDLPEFIEIRRSTRDAGTVGGGDTRRESTPVSTRPLDRLQLESRSSPEMPDFITIRRELPQGHEQRRITSLDSGAYRQSAFLDDHQQEFISVSNVFPRRHGAGSVPPSGEGAGGSAEYTVRRVERVIEPVYREVRGRFPREERVVGIEYVEPRNPPPRASPAARTYSDPRPDPRSQPPAGPKPATRSQKDGVIYIE